MPSWSLLQIPTALTQKDRDAALEILGYGTAVKILDDPYPLGGYSGFEIGLSSEILSTAEISRLGAKSTTQSETSYQTINVGKGVYNNIDTFLQFSFLGQQENMAHFGGQVRWGFYQAEYLPVYLSLNVHGASTNFQNLISTTAYGLDLIAGFKEGDVTLFFGGGPIKAQGVFSGGSGGVTDTGETLKNSLQDSRFLAGLNIKFDKIFVSLELDRYSYPVYSAKLGFRF